MANNLNKLYGFDRSLPEFYKEFGIESTEKVLKGEEYRSAYAPETATGATLMGPFMKALALFTGADTSRRWALGKAADGSYVCELASSSRPELLTIAQWSPDSGKMRAVSYDFTTGQTLKYSLDKTGAPAKVHCTDSTALCLCMMQEFATDSEAAVQLIDVKKMFNKEILCTDMKLSMGRLCDNFYRRTKDRMLNVQLGDKGIPEPMNMAEIKNSAIRIKEVFFGSFEQVGTGSDSGYVDIEEGQYNLGIELTAEEQALVPAEDPDHLVSKVEKKVLDVIYRTWDLGRYAVRVILLEGPPGSGKSEIAKDVARKLGLPFREQGCSDGTTEENLTSYFVPRANGAEEKDIMGLLRRIPSEAEILLAPEKAYKALTGQEPEGPVSKKMVMDTIYERLSALVGVLSYDEHITPLLDTLMHGGLCELAEPGSMLNANALTILNSIMNSSDGTIDTPSGVVRRHPNCVIIATNNPPEPGGYKGLDKAVRDRFERVFYCPTPDRNEVIDRVLEQGFLKDESLIEVMASVLDVIAATVEANGISGYAGMRSLFEWAQDVSFGDNVIDSMMDCVINKVTTNPTEQEIILEALHDNTAIFDMERR